MWEMNESETNKQKIPGWYHNLGIIDFPLQIPFVLESVQIFCRLTLLGPQEPQPVCTSSERKLPSNKENW